MTPVKKRRWPWLVAAALCLSAALFFEFALIGYSMTACVFAFFCGVILLYLLLGKLGLRKLSRVLTVLLVVGVILFVAVEIPIAANARTDGDPGADYLIVLGAGVNGTVPSLSMWDRLNAALDYLNAHPESTAILTGGQGEGEDITEAEAMRVWLTNRGVSPERLVKEEESSSTEENLENALTIIRLRGDNPLGKIAVCSSEYHLYRAKSMAKNLGCEPVGVAAKTSYVSLRINYFIREALAVVYMWVF